MIKSIVLTCISKFAQQIGDTERTTFQFQSKASNGNGVGFSGNLSYLEDDKAAAALINVGDAVLVEVSETEQEQETTPTTTEQIIAPPADETTPPDSDL